ncbi:AraC family transcriptional regulator [Chelatococcus asaccharovorans]|uniref:AraC family transcriptional regulator n=1 Tax=Chelatococcus asaccharovorans TaxID=28210 RepID=UPI00224C7958|nr:AraC family transcriptional regulator [Chelatococcus asaccharovorans]CAH1664832.1 L-rhamnose operon transcriptional activator RhaR [Chelatococcus asaccharovorans]CAH1682231.1 L-rhamnose operon transcriptional activator RhaR [Chelatococcus asaccharovorans]
MEGNTNASRKAATNEAMGIFTLAEGERTRFFACPNFAELDCLTATFRTYRYVPHTHDTFVIGSVIAGCETWTVRGVRGYAGPGDFVFVNPGEVHDGAPHGGGYCYRMSYPSVDLMREIAAELSEKNATDIPYFPDTVVHDPAGVSLFVAAHAAMDARGDIQAGDTQAGDTQAGDIQAGEELLYRAYAHCLTHHARLTPRSATGREADRVARLGRLIAECYADDLSLSRLAAEAGLPRHRLIRAFRRETGLTPHAFLVDRRVIAAQGELRRGATPAEAAAATGFCDQAHLTRAFKARIGITPGAYRAAVS